MGEGKGQAGHITIDQEQEKISIWLAQSPEALAIRSKYAVPWKDGYGVFAVIELLPAYAAECVRAERERCAEYLCKQIMLYEYKHIMLYKYKQIMLHQYKHIALYRYKLIMLYH